MMCGGNLDPALHVPFIPLFVFVLASTIPLSILKTSVSPSPPSLKSTPLQAQRLGHFGRHHRFQLRELLLLEVALVLEPVQLRPQPLRHRVLLWYVWDTSHAGLGLLITKTNVIPASMRMPRARG